MLRTEAVIRPSKLSQEEPLRVYDIFHVWPNGFVQDGVRWASNFFIYLADHAKSPVRVRLWAPGGTDTRNLKWGEEWYVPSPGFGLVSVVADDDVPLRVFWELSAGKA